MDFNTILLIVFAVMMLFCCGGLGRLFSRQRSKDDHPGRHETSAAANGSAERETEGQKQTGGCCH